ncbi:MAG: DUF1287 domain-containing protein [bacterium]
MLDKKPTSVLRIRTPGCLLVIVLSIYTVFQFFVLPGLSIAEQHGTRKNVEIEEKKEKLLQSARKQVKRGTKYNGEGYQNIRYPGGDISREIGVCTDFIIRAFRNAGIDLQKRLHEDAREHFDVYPMDDIWGQTRPDPNIDHRRAPNLEVFFSRRAKQLPVTPLTMSHESYWPGDVVFYQRKGESYPWHVALVSSRVNEGGIPYIYDLYPPKASGKRLLNQFGPPSSHFRWTFKDTDSDSGS